jgi:hypothetical protein
MFCLSIFRVVSGATRNFSSFDFHSKNLKVGIVILGADDVVQECVSGIR